MEKVNTTKSSFRSIAYWVLLITTIIVSVIGINFALKTKNIALINILHIPVTINNGNVIINPGINDVVSKIILYFSTPAIFLFIILICLNFSETNYTESKKPGKLKSLSNFMNNLVYVTFNFKSVVIFELKNLLSKTVDCVTQMDEADKYSSEIIDERFTAIAIKHAYKTTLFSLFIYLLYMIFGIFFIINTGKFFANITNFGVIENIAFVFSILAIFGVFCSKDI